MPNETGWRRLVTAVGTYAPAERRGDLRRETLVCDGKISEQGGKKKKREEENKSVIVLPCCSWRLGSKKAQFIQIGGVWGFLRGFMLNLLVAGVSRDRAVAERELISLCRKTIIRLIEPPGSETLQPEIPALAEQAEPEPGTSLKHGDPAPVPGESGSPGTAREGAGSGPGRAGGPGPASSRERPETLCGVFFSAEESRVRPPAPRGRQISSPPPTPRAGRPRSPGPGLILGP